MQQHSMQNSQNSINNSMGNNTMSSIHQNNGLHNVAHTQNTQGNSINSNSIPQTANNNSQIPNSPNTAFPPQVARLHTPNTNNEHNNNTNWGSSGGANSNQFPSSNSRLQNPHFSPSAGGDEQHPYARPGYQNVYPLENNNAYDFSPMNKALPNATTQMPNGNMANMSNGGILPNGHMSNGNLPKGAVPMSSNILQNLPATVQSPNDSHILNTKQMQTPVSAGYIAFKIFDILDQNVKNLSDCQKNELNLPFVRNSKRIFTLPQPNQPHPDHSSTITPTSTFKLPTVLRHRFQRRL